MTEQEKKEMDFVVNTAIKVFSIMVGSVVIAYLGYHLLKHTVWTNLP